MKALSIKQPWASLIAHGIKDIENRTWRTHFRGRIYIHASAKPYDLRFEIPEQATAHEIFLSTALNKCEENEIFSCIIGEVDIVDCVVNHPSIWAEKTQQIGNTVEGMPLYRGQVIYNWVLANAQLYKNPIFNVKGKLSFWEWNGCHICHKETDSEITCRSCEQIVCENHTVTFNQFTQVDYTLCQNCNHGL